MIDYPNKLNIIFDKLDKNGIKSIITGGYIRDSFLNISSKDIDIELYGVISFKKLEKILKEFGSVNSVGKSFGVCKLRFEDLEIDFTLPRLDSKIDAGHRGFEISIENSLDFKTAALRRDFTMNSLGYDVKEKKILDPYSGLKDLQDGVLRAVNNFTFTEDPLRVLRAIQFCARFNLTMSDELLSLCQTMVRDGTLKELSSERVFLEIQKLLIKSKTPSIGLKLLKDIGAINLFPQLQKLDMQDFNSLLLTIDNMSNLKTNNNKTNMALMLALLSHNFSLEDTKKFINSLSCEKELLQKVLSIVANYKKITLLNFPLENYSLYKLATYASLDELIIINRALSSSNSKLDEIQNRATELGILHNKMPSLLQGKDILSFGLAPSQIYSKILKEAYEAQMNSEFHSYLEAKKWLKDYLVFNTLIF